MKHIPVVFSLICLTDIGFFRMTPRLTGTFSVVFSLLLISSFAFSQEADDLETDPLQIEIADWKTPDQNGYTHLFLFETAGGFVPKSPKEFSERFRAILKESGDENIVVGSFKAGKGKDGQIIGRACTSTPEDLKEALALSPDVELTRIIALTPEVYEKHTGGTSKKSTKKNDSLPRFIRDNTVSAEERLKQIGYLSYRYLVIFEPDGKFRPQTTQDLIRKFFDLFSTANVSVGAGCLNAYDTSSGWSYVQDAKAAVQVLISSPELKPTKVYFLTPRIIRRYPCRPGEVEKIIWKTPDKDGFTHLIDFAPTGKFQPKTEQEFQEKCDEVLPGNVSYGYLRVEKDKNSKFVGRICTASPEELKAAIDSSSDLKVIKTTPLTEVLFCKHVRIPTIVKMIPENGEAFLIAAKIKQLSITFDQDMDTKSTGWGKGGEYAPEIVGEAKWTNKRTCLLPVKLEPGRTYLLEINSSEDSEFLSEEGLPLPPSDLIFETASDEKPEGKG